MSRAKKLVKLALDKDNIENEDPKESENTSKPKKTYAELQNCQLVPNVILQEYSTNQPFLLDLEVDFSKYNDPIFGLEAHNNSTTLDLPGCSGNTAVSEISNGHVVTPLDDQQAEEINNDAAIFDSDDSINDKDYTPSGDDSSSPENTSSEIEVNPNNDVEKRIIAEAQDEKKKPRKIIARPETWKRNVKKMRVNSGLPYVSEGNREIPGKRLKPPCTTKCRSACTTKFTDADRLTIHTCFWKQGDNALQRQFVSSHMETLKVKYRRAIEGSNRSENLCYYLTLRGIKIQVCKTFFMNTLDIGDKFIRTTWKKSNGNALIERDRRGNFNKRETINTSIKEKIVAHINSFERIESHYLRAQTTREYIDGSLTIAQMYRYYKSEQQAEGLPVAKKCTYEHIFKTQFNISFFQPKKDQCAICETFKNSDTDERLSLQKGYERHINNKIKSREEKARDVEKGKQDSSFKIACFDLQAVLPTPCGDVSTFYYKCRLNCLNFTVFEIPSKRGFCYFWHEAIANRGANEIATCILHYLKTECKGKDVIFYSDNCVGQNKNKMIVSMYLCAVNKFDVKSITHKFLTVGHTQNEGDSMHASIERQKRRVLRSGPIYVPSQWAPIIRAAKKEGTPYIVNELATEDFLDFKKFSDTIGKHFSINSKQEKVVWNEIQVLRVEKNYPTSFFYKTDFDFLEYEQINIQEKLRRCIDISACYPEKAFVKAPSISQKTKEHLAYLCAKNAIKKVYHGFYNNIIGEK
ncbi:uncharacterized protein LOC116164961 [Photinus pyralis]|uniref:uncharacterized protein LOC116164961 n=1 Tax=Photinus pyralis TaxID=7054 RepID=UPI001267003C|nr:uncharacterized protein LOC116164961 [Photinus pyralis]